MAVEDLKLPIFKKVRDLSHVEGNFFLERERKKLLFSTSVKKVLFYTNGKKLLHIFYTCEKSTFFTSGKKLRNEEKVEYFFLA